MKKKSAPKKQIRNRGNRPVKKKFSLKLPSFPQFRVNPIRVIVAALFLIVYVLAILLVNRSDPNAIPTAASQNQYAVGRVTAVLSDNTAPDTWTEGRRIGAQQLQIKLMTGAHKGTVLEATNTVTAYSGLWTKVGTTVTVRLDTDDSGNPVISAVYNFNRIALLLGLVLVFAVLLVAIGGKKGLMTLIGLAFTLTSLWYLLIPLIRRGLPSVPGTLIFVVLSIAVGLYLLAGPTKKTACAILGSLGGVAAIWLCLTLVNVFSPINGFNLNGADSLVLIAQDDGLLISGLLVSSVLIFSFSAVMHASLSVSAGGSALAADDATANRRRLFCAGLRAGRSNLGLVAGVLILAVFGSSLVTLIMFQAYAYPGMDFLNNDGVVVVQLLQCLGGSIGALLTIPITALIGSLLMVKKTK